MYWYYMWQLSSTRLGERKWTQADLARMTGIRPNTINDLYHEITDHVNLEHINLICEAFECPISDILEYVPDAEPNIKRSRSGAPVKKK